MTPREIIDEKIQTLRERHPAIRGIGEEELYEFAQSVAQICQAEFLVWLDQFGKHVEQITIGDYD